MALNLKKLALVLALASSSFAGKYVSFDQSKLSNESFFEQFEYSDLSESGWIPSKSHKTGPHDYLGRWEIGESHQYAALDGEKGLVMANEAAYYAISKKLPQTFVKGENGDLVVQFEVKFHDDVSCTGAYIKLLSAGSDSEEFNDRTPFEVMFGPDICGSENKVHFIIRKKDEQTGEVVEHKLKRPPMGRKHALTNLYTLVFRADGSTELRLNGEVAKAGNPITSSKFMEPPLTQPEFIVDKDAKMPLDWDDRLYITDPDAKKPADWDEVYGRPWIPDPNDSKPEGWNDDPTVPSEIPDPEATKPDLWSDEEDGEWEPPMIRNPECSVGCGEWKPKTIPNVNYKGVWTAPQIENPNYQGIWRAPKIKNPLYGKEDNSKLIGPIDAVGFELWTMTRGVMFTNIYVGKSVAEAERIGNETFVPKSDLEWKIYNENRPKPEFDAKPPPPTFENYLEEEDELPPLESLSEILSLAFSFYKNLYYEYPKFWEDFKVDPALAIASNPIAFAVYCTVLVLGFGAVLISINVVIFILLQAKNAAKQKDEEERRKKRLEEKAKAEAKTTEGTEKIESIEATTVGLASGTEVTDREGLTKRENAGTSDA